MPIANIRAVFRAATPQITSTATDAILNWQRSRYPDTARIVGSDAISDTELIVRKIDRRWPQAYQSVIAF
jgi:hypothetical protein